MQHAIAEMLSGPWVIERSRLPFVLGVLARAAAQDAPPDATTQARFHAAAARAASGRQAGNGAIAVLPFYGIAVQRTDDLGEAFGLLSLLRFAQSFRAALADDSVGGILIDVDSPGGSIYGVAELADEVYRARNRKPVFAIADSLAASGAYWIASAASQFYVTPSGEVGSIGVVTAHQSVSKAFEKAGIETTLISAGRYKTEGNPFEPLGADARRHVQNRVNDYYRMFISAVAKHRSVTESAVRNGFGQGRLLDAERAKREGMVDGIATLDDVVRRLARRIGQGKVANTARVAAARYREIDALNRRPSSGASRSAMRATTRQREIDLLTL
ncbi:signal peptide peptidase SppA [Burkholderia pseudomallei]|uniref:signal peptide peptidase SppA n=1 Tax=Burkholderia pseudomallei TaxID=28450 RepID=UPI00050E18EA|nr:signal peptide peptidase SppA [Burkholderia pseudomallei]KGC58609.1 signal peptide peptidase SppA, 36K type [Burkholderia pseudomallei]